MKGPYLFDLSVQDDQFIRQPWERFKSWIAKRPGKCQKIYGEWSEIHWNIGNSLCYWKQRILVLSAIARKLLLCEHYSDMWMNFSAVKSYCRTHCCHPEWLENVRNFEVLEDWSPCVSYILVVVTPHMLIVTVTGGYIFTSRLTFMSLISM